MKADSDMKKKTSYNKTPKNIAKAIEKIEVIKDFLPSPDKMIFKADSPEDHEFLQSLRDVRKDFKNAGYTQKDIRRIVTQVKKTT